MGARPLCLAVPPAYQRDGKTVSSPTHSPANAASFRCSSSGVCAARWSAILASLDGLDDFLRGVVEIVCRQHVETGFADDLLAGVDIGAFETHHQRHLEADFLDRGDHALGDDVA